MKTVGIIAEYNPLHNGHKYHMETIRKITNADYCIVVMSGNFTQRGEPALMDKYVRAKMALECGADLVLELPVCYACASAPYFATGAVTLLDKLGVTDFIGFGSECGDVSVIQKIAETLTQEPTLYTKQLKMHLKAGLSYPSAQEKALIDFFGQSHTDNLLYTQNLLSSPNNILGIEYCKALYSRHSKIRPLTIARQGGGYSDAALQQENSSALAIRNAFHAISAKDFHNLSTHVPDYVFTQMESDYRKTFPIFPDMLSSLLHYRLLLDNENGFSEYLDISEELSDRICNMLPDYKSFSSFCALLKSKDLTYTRISRSLLHILLNIRKTDMAKYQANDWIFYGRILGFKKESTPLLSAIKANADIPLISKLADARKYLNDTAMKQLKKDIQAAHIYNTFIQYTYGTKLPVEMQRQIIRI